MWPCMGPAVFMASQSHAPPPHSRNPCGAGRTCCSLSAQQGGLLGPGHSVLETPSNTVWEVSALYIPPALPGPVPRHAQIFPNPGHDLGSQFISVPANVSKGAC